MSQTAMQQMYEELMCYEYTIPLELIVKCKELIEVEKEQMCLKLPSDEEIATKIENMEPISLEIEVGYRAGARWMRNKIINR